MGWSLKRNTGHTPGDAILLGHQNDGHGDLWLGVAHTKWGDIPGKATGNTCWIAYDGKEHEINSFSWVCAPPGSAR